jgi:hypothetical protein
MPAAPKATDAAERVRQAALELAQPSASSFTTERAGSSYVINPDGTTSRTKSASPGNPMHQDAGQKRTSTQTFYLSPEDAVLASRAYAAGNSPLSGQPLTRLVVRDSRPVLMRMQFERAPADPASNLPGKPIKELGYSEQALQPAAGPSVGLSPLEFFDDGFHLGSKIISLAP